MSVIVLVHGWSFRASVWEAVRAELPASLTVQAVDLGFYDHAAAMTLPPASEIALIVGHSYGTLWALQQTPPSVPLLAVNGFARFCSGDGQQNGTPGRLVDRMINRLAADPLGVVQNFRQRCGISSPETGTANPEALRQGLEALRHDDARAVLTQRHSLRALAGALDEIAPPALSQETFAAPSLTMIDDGGHLLPLTHAKAVAAMILAMLP